MALNFIPVKRQKDVATEVVLKDAATTDILPGQFCSIDPTTGLAVKAIATSSNLWYVVAVNDETNEVTVEADPKVVYQGTADAPFAQTNANTEVDIAIDGSGNQVIDLGASSTDVLKVVATKDAGTIGSAEKVLVKINQPMAV